MPRIVLLVVCHVLLLRQLDLGVVSVGVPHLDVIEDTDHDGFASECELGELAQLLTDQESAGAVWLEFIGGGEEGAGEAAVGGVSAAGGVGKVTGALIGALVMASLTSGMNLMGIGISYQYIVRGAVLAAAVIFDVATRNR